MKITPKNAEKFKCNNCDFKCSKYSDWNRHIMTLKHKNRTFLNNLEHKNTQITPNYQIFKCKKCDKEYRARNSLWYHEKKCNISVNQDDEDVPVTNLTNLISEIIKDNNEIIKDNNEFKQLIIELCKNGINNNIITNNTNCNNKTFNLHVFLNETCKNAMNIMDFANSIQLKLTDLENIGELGYVEGISKIIIDNLKMLDITERPVHCSDFKRDVLYVKDSDKWERESDNYTKIKKVINCITDKNISLIPKWKKENPDCLNSNSNKSTQINKIIMQTMETDSNKKDKIIKNIAKEVVIDKN